MIADDVMLPEASEVGTPGADPDEAVAAAGDWPYTTKELLPPVFAAATSTSYVVPAVSAVHEPMTTLVAVGLGDTAIQGPDPTGVRYCT